MSETKYGFLNGVAIDPGEGWELVPAKEALNGGCEAYRESDDAWSKKGWSEWLGTYGVSAFRCHESDSNILAFRRPKTVQAGQGESEAVRLDEAKENAHLVEYYVGKFKDFEDRLAAQSKALEKAEKVIKDRLKCSDPIQTRIHDMAMWRNNPCGKCPTCEALTLIQQAKEVGK